MNDILRDLLNLVLIIKNQVKYQILIKQSMFGEELSHRRHILINKERKLNPKGVSYHQTKHHLHREDTPVLMYHKHYPVFIYQRPFTATVKIDDNLIMELRNGSWNHGLYFLSDKFDLLIPYKLPIVVEYIYYLTNVLDRPVSNHHHWLTILPKFLNVPLGKTWKGLDGCKDPF